MLIKEQIESTGWVWKRTYDREIVHKGKYPTKIEFELGNPWKDKRAGFLSFLPETGKVKISTVDEGFNIDGPNCSTKFNGVCTTLEEFQIILKFIGL